MKISEYEKKLREYKKSRKDIEVATDLAWKEIQLYTKKENVRKKTNAKEKNEAPCSVCGGVRYILKYREVVGEIHGDISGSFSLFGGTISGRIDGETHTNPILSCRDCGNEKKIIIPKFRADYKVLEELMPSVFEYSRGSAGEWIKNQGIEVARQLGTYLFLPEDYKDIRDKERFTDEALLSVGMKFKYPRRPKKPFLYGIRKKVVDIFEVLSVIFVEKKDL